MPTAEPNPEAAAKDDKQEIEDDKCVIVLSSDEEGELALKQVRFANKGHIIAAVGDATENDGPDPFGEEIAPARSSGRQ